MNYSIQAIYWLKRYLNFFRELTIPIRTLLIKPVKSLPFTSEVIGPPKGFYQSTYDWYKLNKDNVHAANYQEIYPRHQIYRSYPNTVEQNIHWKFKQEQQRESPATFVAVVPGGRIWGSSSTVISADDKVLSDVSIEFGRNNPDGHSINFQWKLPPIHNIEGVVAVLAAAGSEHYFHWMFDTLPRLELLRHSNIKIKSIDRFIVNSCHLPFHKDTLEALGISLEKVIEIQKFTHIKATQLVVPSLTGMTGNMTSWACNFLRREFLPTHVVEKSDKVERIYISRTNARYRKVINEAEITNFLKKFGFTTIVLETLPIVEQALLFSSAKIVVAPHGAGLTNIVFCNPGTKVIEFFSPGYVNVCYWSLSNQVKLEYYYLIGEGQRPAEHIDNSQGRANIIVNLNTLSSLMKLAGIV